VRIRVEFAVGLPDPPGPTTSGAGSLTFSLTL